MENTGNQFTVTLYVKTGDTFERLEGMVPGEIQFDRPCVPPTVRLHFHNHEARLWAAKLAGDERMVYVMAEIADVPSRTVWDAVSASCFPVVEFYRSFMARGWAYRELVDEPEYVVPSRLATAEAWMSLSHILEIDLFQSMWPSLWKIYYRPRAIAGNALVVLLVGIFTILASL